MANPQLNEGYFKLANKIREHLAQIRIPGQAMQVLWVVLGKTYGWNKKKDAISLSQIAEETGMCNTNVVRARDKLVKMNLIATTKKGKNGITTYSFQKDYTKWDALPKKVRGLPKKVTGTTKKGNKVLPKKVNTKDIKDTLQKTVGAHPRHQEMIDLFCGQYEKKFNRKYGFSGGKDGQLIKELLGRHPPEDLIQIINQIFVSTDPFYSRGGGITIGVLTAMSNRLLQEVVGGQGSTGVEAEVALAARLREKREEKARDIA